MLVHRQRGDPRCLTQYQRDQIILERFPSSFGSSLTRRCALISLIFPSPPPVISLLGRCLGLQNLASDPREGGPGSIRGIALGCAIHTPGFLTSPRAPARASVVRRHRRCRAISCQSRSGRIMSHTGPTPPPRETILMPNLLDRPHYPQRLATDHPTGLEA